MAYEDEIHYGHCLRIMDRGKPCSCNAAKEVCGIIRSLIREVPTPRDVPKPLILEQAHKVLRAIGG